MYKGGGTTSKDLSNEPKTIAVRENVASLQSVKDGNAKNLLSEKTKMKLCTVTISVPLKEGRQRVVPRRRGTQQNMLRA